MWKVIEKTIVVKYQFIWYHKWENAPEEVRFLQNEHRHNFFIEVEFYVNHNDRDLEFYIMRDKISKAIESLYEKHYLDGFKIESCEQVAQDLLEYFDPEFNIKIVSVYEDNDNGSKVNFKD